MPLPAKVFNPAEPLSDGRRERFAHLRLIGLTPPIAAREAGLKKKNGAPIADGNAWKIDHEPQVTARKAFLSGHETAIVRETRGFVRNRLMSVASLDLLRDFAILGDVEVPGTIGQDGKPATVKRIIGIDWAALKASEHSIAISTFKFDADTGIMTEFDRDDAMAALGQIRDMYGIKAPRRTELTGKDGAAIDTALTVRYDISDTPLTPAEWEQQYAGGGP
jgi:hypothetical protein